METTHSVESGTLASSGSGIGSGGEFGIVGVMSTETTTVTVTELLPSRLASYFTPFELTPISSLRC